MPSARLVEEGQKTNREVTITTRNWNCIRHTGIRRKANTKITKQALEWSPQRQRKHGKLKNTRLGVLTGLKKTCKVWGEAKTIEHDRGRLQSPYVPTGRSGIPVSQVHILLYASKLTSCCFSWSWWCWTKLGNYDIHIMSTRTNVIQYKLVGNLFNHFVSISEFNTHKRKLFQRGLTFNAVI